MEQEKKTGKFTVQHHALMLGWINREVINRFGEVEGKKVLLDATTRYALQRGRRMAIRGLAHGDRLTGFNYLCYGEWIAEKGSMKTKIIDRSPKLLVHAQKCPWDSIWREYDLLEYGKYFCQVADKALYEGFNPSLHLDVNGTRTNGSPCCQFVFHDISLTITQLFVLMFKKRILSKKIVMPWEYHTGHVFKTFSETIISAFRGNGEEAIIQALREFRSFYGQAAAATVEKFLKKDFNVLSA